MKIKYRYIVQYLLLILIVLFVLTGYGITHNRLVSQLSFGLLNKGLAFKIHSNLIVPLLILLVLHIFRIKRKK